MKTLIFADVHLKVDPANRESLADFIRFLRSIDPAEIDRVIIVGDLFDFWFEYRHVIFSGYFGVLRVLADLRDAGVEFHLVCGNHDFWAGRFFERELGFGVHRAEFSCVLDGKRALFVHGDGLNPKDTGYRLYRRIARSRPFVGIVRQFPADWAMSFAQWFSRASRSRQDPAGHSRLAEVQACRAYAREVISSGRADIVVCGHTHVAAYEEIAGVRSIGIYANTGGWMDDRAYWLWDGAALSRYAGLLTDRRSVPTSQIEERQHAELGTIHVARQKPDEA